MTYEGRKLSACCHILFKANQIHSVREIAWEHVPGRRSLKTNVVYVSFIICQLIFNWFFSRRMLYCPNKCKAFEGNINFWGKFLSKIKEINETNSYATVLLNFFCISEDFKQISLISTFKNLQKRIKHLKDIRNLLEISCQRLVLKFQKKFGRNSVSQSKDAVI